MQQSKLNKKKTKIAKDGIYELTYQEEERDGGDGGVVVAARWPMVMSNTIRMHTNHDHRSNPPNQKI